MWIHIVIFIMAFGVVLVWKAGWIRLEGLADKKSMQLFFLVAVCGNILGMMMTLTQGMTEVYPEHPRIKKETSGAYTEEFQLSVDGEEPETLQVQIPEKETAQNDTVTEKEEPETPEKTREKELLEEIARYNEQKQDPDYYYLPDQWNGKKLEWQKPGDNSGSMIAALAFFAAFVIMLKKARETQQELAKRSEQLLTDYPSLIMKFTLLVQAGMTARRAFQKIGSDYLKNRPKTERYAYEAIVIACHEMESGVAELEAYRRFGERCGQIKYKTFSTLLIQNLQKGSRRMAEMLEREAMEAWDERKRKARVLGEAAATKLLVPMIMMLAVVMAVVMIPAFLSFYG